MKNTKTLKIASFTTIAAVCAISGVFAINANTVSANTGEFHELGASIRVAEDKGIRFAFGLSEKMTGEGYEIGTLVIPKSVLGSNELNHNSDTIADTVEVDYQAIPCTKNWVPHHLIKGAKEGYNYYSAVLTNIPNIEYNTVLVARSYYVKDGVYTYSAPVERSIGYVASAALNGGFEDTKGILNDIVTTGFGETALTAAAKVEVVDANKILDVTASNELGYLPVWSTSDETVATVDKTGKVTGVKSGEVTITATIGETIAEKKIYVAGGLTSSQIGVHAYGWNQTGNATYFNMATGNNNEMVVTAKFAGSTKHYPALSLISLDSVDYFKKLIENGISKLTFNLQVGGTNATNVSDLYVFGKALTSFAQKDGFYIVEIDLQYLVDNYAKASGMGTRVEAYQSEVNNMFLAWKSTDWTTRDYVFTFSNVAYRGGLFAENIGCRVNGHDVTGNESYLKIDKGLNGEMVITTLFQASWDPYHAGLVWDNIESKEYYDNLVSKGYKYLTFDLKVDGADKDKVSDLYMFCGQQLSKIEQQNGVYKVKILVSDISRVYDAVQTYIPNGERKGQTGSRHGMFLAWRDNRGSDRGLTRNYIFTISNVAYVTE